MTQMTLISATIKGDFQTIRLIAFVGVSVMAGLILNSRAANVVA